jgi:hypothetical protein
MADEKKTALEILLELPSTLKRLEAKINVLDTNLKILNSKLNKMKLAQESEPEGSHSDLEKEKGIEEVKKFLPSATPGPELEKEQVDRNTNSKEISLPKKLVLGPIKVFSTIKTSTGRPVDGMKINIFDHTNDLVRQLNTDKNGYWECKLPSGKYSLEMIHPRLKTMNKNFELKKDIKEFEVTDVNN